jgi:hypothetical protein
MVKSFSGLHQITSYSLSMIKYNEEKKDGLEIEIEHLNSHFSSLITSQSINIFNENIFEKNITTRVNETLKLLMNKIYEKKLRLISADSLDSLSIDKETLLRGKDLNEETKPKKFKISGEIIHHTLKSEINSLRRKIEVKDHELNYLKVIGSNVESSKFCTLLTLLHKRDKQILNNERQINFQADEIQGLNNQLSNEAIQLSELEKLAAKRATQISNLQTELDSLKIKKRYNLQYKSSSYDANVTFAI